MADDAQETLAHPVRVDEADQAGDLLEGLAAALDHGAGRLDAQALDRLGRRHAGGSGKDAAELDDGIEAFSETDFTEDLKTIKVPTLVMHGDDDQIVPIAASALTAVTLLERGTLKVYERFPHGMCTTHAETVSPDVLAFVKG